MSLWFLRFDPTQLTGNEVWPGKCLPPPNENQDAWFEKTIQGLLNPPSWYRFSNHVATLTFLMLFGIITFVVTSISGTWMRLLYAVAWLMIAIRLGIWRTGARAGNSGGLGG